MLELNYHIREQLLDTNVCDVSDVIGLSSNKKYCSQTSFCISLNYEKSFIRIFQANLWPEGVMVRPFTQSQKSRNMEFAPPSR